MPANRPTILVTTIDDLSRRSATACTANGQIGSAKCPILTESRAAVAHKSATASHAAERGAALPVELSASQHTSLLLPASH